MTRRQWMAALATTGASAYAADAWKKKFSSWTEADARAIWSRSPWAITSKVEFKIQGKDVEGPRSGGVIGPMEGPPGGNGTIGPPGGAPARSGGGLKQTLPGDIAEFKAVVRWESALPMRLARGREGVTVPPNQYTISVSGFPILKQDIPASIPAFKGTTRIERVGKEWLRPSRVEAREAVLVFVFDGTADPVTVDDREVLFATRLGGMNLQAKFNLREMWFEKKLEL